PFLWNKKPDDSTRFNVVEYMTNRSVGANFIRSLTFSFATSPADSTIFSEAFQGTALAFGAHFQLIPGKISAEVRDNLLAWFHTSRLDNVIDAMLLDLNSSADAEIEDVDLWLDDQLETGSFAKLSDLNKDVIRNLLHLKLKKNKLTQKDIVMLTRIQGSLDKKAKLQLTNINKFKFPLTREGFMLEGAVAHAKIATEGTWKKLEGAKTSFWLTPSYRFNINKDPERVDFVDFMGVVRYTDNHQAVDSSNYLDAGAKVQWIHERISFSGEAIYRYASEKPEAQKRNYTSRTAFTFSYKLNELVTFKTTFGSTFDGNSTRYDENEKLFIVGGFNFAFSDLISK
ncbi:MAG TPA: hypothetical protein VGD65_06250, partial [Chryseosolibacter sp.]